jgi:glucokinase
LRFLVFHFILISSTTEFMSPASDETVFLGIDVGGTNIKLGLVSDYGQVLAASSFATQAQRSVVETLIELEQAYERLLEENKISQERVVAAGIGTPGPIDVSQGMILQPTNLKGWWNFPIRDSLSELLEVPVTFTNDANAAAFGEYWLGSAKELPSLVMFTLGTGVGGGIIVEDFCLEGTHSLAAELGHICVDWSNEARLCPCGVQGHLEAYASATAVVARTLERIKSGERTNLQPAGLTAKEIAVAAESGDSLAQTIIKETAQYLARGIAIVAHTIDPAAVLIGGAMTFGGNENQIGRGFLQTIKTQVANSVFPEIAQALTINFATLGSDAGFLGAAGLARLHYYQFQPRGST